MTPPVVGPDPLAVLPDPPVVGPDSPLVSPDPSAILSDSPVVGPDPSVVSPDPSVILPDPFVILPDPLVILPKAGSPAPDVRTSARVADSAAFAPPKAGSPAPDVRTQTIADLLRDGSTPLFSFEFFPPKDDAASDQLWRTVANLAPLRPDFVSVTYGANGSQRDRTVELTTRLSTQTKLRVMGHLTCVDQSVSDLESVLVAYARGGVDHIFAIRGDMPGGPTLPWVKHPDGLANATQLVELIKETGDFCVGVAAFPDPHPAQRDPALDARILKDKWEAGASFAITQLFFRAQAYVDLVDRVRSLGCDIPIIPGIMPITMISQVVTFAEMSGAEIPAPIRARLDAAPDPASVRHVGTQIATELCQELLDGGAPGLHFFTQNKSAATREIWRNLRPPL